MIKKIDHIKEITFSLPLHKKGAGDINPTLKELRQLPHVLEVVRTIHPDWHKGNETQLITITFDYYMRQYPNSVRSSPEAENTMCKVVACLSRYFIKECEDNKLNTLDSKYFVDVGIFKKYSVLGFNWFSKAKSTVFKCGMPLLTFNEQWALFNVFKKYTSFGESCY